MASPAESNEVAIRIIYCNTTGLSIEKARALWALADENTLVFAAETWHLPQGLDTLGDLLFVTTPEARIRGTVVSGRRHGGLALWVGARLKGRISNTQTHQYGIAVTISGRTIHAVYMPPTLEDDPSKPFSFKTYLRPKDRSVPDIILGDVNIRFGRAFGDTESGPRTRLRVMNDFIAEHTLTHIQPAPDSARPVKLDHVFVRPGISTRLIAYRADFKTDHPIIDVSASWKAPTTLASTSDHKMDLDRLEPLLQPTLRLQLKNLDSTKHRNALFWHWHRAYPKVLAALKKARSHLDPSSAQSTVNKADKLIGSTLWDVARRALGVYQVDEAKQKPDYLGQGLKDKPGAASAMRQYRRAQRGSQPIVVSRKPDSTPVS
ncbi:hypothetical protein A4X13_0g8359, partial [Tilletia indica]